MEKTQNHSKTERIDDESRASLPNIITGVFFQNYGETGDHFEKGYGNREHTYFIPFGIIFDSNPIVHVSLNGFDLSKNYNQRLVVKVNSIEKGGFYAKFETWSDSKVYHVRIDWIAFKNN